MNDSQLRTGIAVRWLRALAFMTILAPWLTAHPVQAAAASKADTQASATRAKPRPTLSRPTPTRVTSRSAVATSKPAISKGKRTSARTSGRQSRLQCVPFARNASGIVISGNAHLWWGNAEGVYARGQVPESGSVLSFQANRSMPLGHVAVVNRVINQREVEIDHANWAGPGGRKGQIKRKVSVVDVSEGNDWTAVRVELGQSGNYGSIYPTNGFIYERPADGGTMVAAASIKDETGPVALLPGAAAPVTGLNPAPRDLRPAEIQTVAHAQNGSKGQDGGYASVSYAGGRYEEVAEAPAPKRPAKHRKRARSTR